MVTATQWADSDSAGMRVQQCHGDGWMGRFAGCTLSWVEIGHRLYPLLSLEHLSGSGVDPAVDPPSAEAGQNREFVDWKGPVEAFGQDGFDRRSQGTNSLCLR